MWRNHILHPSSQVFMDRKKDVNFFSGYTLTILYRVLLLQVLLNMVYTCKTRCKIHLLIIYNKNAKWSLRCLNKIWKKFNVPYWMHMGGPNSLSYIGSSIHLFQNYKFSRSHASRIKQHITHAENHKVAVPHTYL